MHDVALSIAPVAVILLGIMFGILYNQRAIDKVEAQLGARMDKMEARMESSFALIRHTLDVIQSDLKAFHRILGQHDEGIATLKKRTDL